MAVLLIGDNEINGKIVCDGNINTECTEFINYGDGVDVIHLYVSSGYIPNSFFQLYSRPINSAELWTLEISILIGGYYDYVWQGINIYDTNVEYKAMYKGLAKYYTVVSPCVPDWQCRQPLDGYETDINNCGETDRYNEACIEVCVPDWQCRQPLDGYETDVNNCGEADRYNKSCEPIIFCWRGCAKDGSYDYHTGNVVDGKCEIIENSELCGYVPPEEPEEPLKYLLYGGLGLAALFGLKKLNKK